MPIPVNEPDLSGNEKRYLMECIETGWISSEGPCIARFEEQFAARVGRKHGVAVSSGSAALDIAVQALQLGPGDEVIMPAFTIISPAASVVRAGAVPVLVDSDPLTWNMDVAAVERRITPRTRAILVVHIYGLPTDMDPLLDVAARHGLRIIEDAAEMHGQTYASVGVTECGGVGVAEPAGRGASTSRPHPDTPTPPDPRTPTLPHPDTSPRPCGSFGDISIFSFYPNKHVTTGEGGMVVTDDARLAERSRALRNLCFQPKRRFVHEELGWNYRMTNLQAALGLAQLERLDEFAARKRRMGARYTAALQDLAVLQLPLPRTAYAENIYWVYGIVLGDALGFDAEEAMRRLGHGGVGTRPFFWPMHEQPVFRRMGLFRDERYPVAERLARRGFYIPSGLALTDGQIDAAAEAVRRILS